MHVTNFTQPQPKRVLSEQARVGPSTLQTAQWRVERRSECSRLKRSKEVLREPCCPDFKYIV